MERNGIRMLAYTINNTSGHNLTPWHAIDANVNIYFLFDSSDGSFTTIHVQHKTMSIALTMRTTEMKSASVAAVPTARSTNSYKFYPIRVLPRLSSQLSMRIVRRCCVGLSGSCANTVLTMHMPTSKKKSKIQFENQTASFKENSGIWDSDEKENASRWICRFGELPAPMMFRSFGGLRLHEK